MIKNEIVAKRFRTWRLKNGMTQKNIADVLNLGRGYISKVESRGGGFSQQSLIILATKLKLNIHWLLTGKEK